MGIPIQFDVILAYVAGLALLYVLGWLLLVPLKLVLKLIVNGLIGGLMLWGLNLLGGLLHFTIAVNPVNALLAGFLGVPGVILVVLLQWILNGTLAV